MVDLGTRVSSGVPLMIRVTPVLKRRMNSIRVLSETHIRYIVSKEPVGPYYVVYCFNIKLWGKRLTTHMVPGKKWAGRSCFLVEETSIEGAVR